MIDDAEERDILRRFEALGAGCAQDAAGGVRLTTPFPGDYRDSPVGHESRIRWVLRQGCERLPRKRLPLAAASPTPELLFYDVLPGTGRVAWLGPVLDPKRKASGVVDLLQPRRVPASPLYKTKFFGRGRPDEVASGRVALVFLKHARIELATIEGEGDHGGFLVRLWHAPDGQTHFDVPAGNVAPTVDATPALPAQLHARSPASAAKPGHRQSTLATAKRAQSACRHLPDVAVKLGAVERALSAAPATPSVRQLLRHLRHAAHDPGTAGQCRLELQRLATDMDARLCREDAATLEPDLALRQVILDGDAAAATRTITAALALPDDGDARHGELEHCLHAIATTTSDAAATAPTLRRRREEHGGRAIDPEVLMEAEQACASLPQATLVRGKLRSPPTTRQGWQALRDSIEGASAAAINCRAAVARAEASSHREGCRSKLRAALRQLHPTEAPVGTLEELAERTAYEIRAGHLSLWESAEVRECLAAASPQVAARLKRELGEPADDVRQATEESALLNARSLRHAAREATDAALGACSAVTAVPPGAGLRLLDRAGDLRAYDAAANAAAKELQDLSTQQAAESQHGAPTHLASQGAQVQGCLAAAEKALARKEQSLCAPLLLRAAETPSAAPLQEASKDRVIRAAVAAAQPGEGEDVLRCARALDANLTALLLRQKELALREPPISQASEQAKSAQRAVCRAVAMLGGPPLNPLTPVTFLGLAGLPEWSPRLRSWLDHHGQRAPNRNAIHGGAALGSFDDLHAAIHLLSDHHSEFDGLATLPCSEDATSYAQVWRRLADSGTRAVGADALLADLTALHAAMMTAAQDAHRRSGRGPRQSIFQNLWESFLRYGLQHPDAPVQQIAARLQLENWLGAGTPASIAAFVRQEAMFYLVLFDTNWILRRLPKNETVWTRLSGHLRWLGSQWPWRLTSTEGEDLADVAQMAVLESQAAREHPNAAEELAIFVNPGVRASIWNADDYRRQLSARVSPTSYLPAPHVFPLIPFA